MLKKEITYKDLDENDVTEVFWFHLNKAELSKMALSKEGKEGGFETWVRKIQASNDGEVIVENFEKILLATIGERSEDNKSFMKTDEIRDRFRFSDAYSVLFMEMVTDADKMSAFINGVVPSSMRDEVAASTASALSGISASSDASQPAAIAKGEPNPSTPKDDRPDWIKDPSRIPTEAELKGATVEQLQEAFRRKGAAAGPVTQEQVANPQ